MPEGKNAVGFGIIHNAATVKPAVYFKCCSYKKTEKLYVLFFIDSIQF